MSGHREWLAVSRPHNPGDPETPGIYALYQGGVLKYMGQSRQCAFRVRKHLTHGRDWLERKPAWETGRAATARVQPLPHLPGGKGSEDERRRELVERRWISRLRPPCNVQGKPGDPQGGRPMFPRFGGFKSLLRIPPAPSLTGRIVPRRKGLLSLIGLKQSGKLFPEPKLIRTPPKSE